jgi:eukaryotic-like serine/threonine-protein kinase
MPVDPNRAQAVFLAAAGCEEARQRAAVLDRECAGDAGLRERVEVLLRAHDDRYSLLDRPLVASVGRGEWPEVGSDSSFDTTSTPAAGHFSRPDPDDLTRGFDGPTQVADRSRTAIPGYEILGELGRGGMGAVYKARRVLLDRPCALKMILGGPQAAPGAVARFLAEAQAGAR